MSSKTKKIQKKAEQKVQEQAVRPKPTPEDVARLKQRYEESSKTLVESVYEIGTAEQAAKFVDFLEAANAKFAWSQDEWQGVLTLQTFIETEKQRLAEQTGEPLKVPFAALQFVYYMLSKPSGVGVADAQSFKDNVEMYIEVFNAIQDQVNVARESYKESDNAMKEFQIAEYGFWSKLDDEGNVVPDMTEQELADLQQQFEQAQEEVPTCSCDCENCEGNCENCTCEKE